MSVEVRFTVKGYIEYEGEELEYEAALTEDDCEIRDISGSYPEWDGDAVEEIEDMINDDANKQVSEWKKGDE